MKTDLFQSCGHCWVFLFCRHIECSTFTASSFRIWNSSTGLPSPPLALFVVMLSKALLTSHSRMSGFRWVITPSLLSGSWRSFLYHFHIALIHGPNIPGSYAILLFTTLDLASTTSHIHNWVLFLLWLHPFILPGVIFPLISCSILGTYRSGGFLFQLSYHFAFSYCLWGSQGKNTEVVYHPFLQWTTCCQTSPPWPAHLGWPHTAWLSFRVRQGCGLCDQIG